jgi:hypothetical protein
VGEVDDDSDPPVDATVGLAVFIDTDRGHTIESGSISDQQGPAEVEHSRAHGVPGGGEVLRDDVDAHLVDDDGLQRPQACGTGELRSAGTGFRRCLGPPSVAVRAGVSANPDCQGDRGQADRGMDESADSGGSDESSLPAGRGKSRCRR